MDGDDLEHTFVFHEPDDHDVGVDTHADVKQLWFLLKSVADVFFCCQYLLMSYNSNLHMAVARMDIAADNGDGKPLTNGVAKEEVRVKIG